MALLSICAAIVTGVFGVMIYSIAAFRGAEPSVPRRRNALLEVLWATVPIVIMVSTAAPAVSQLLDPASPDRVAQPARAPHASPAPEPLASLD
ncbi:MAG TPA: cytochrome c oxidase subunit II transmembrane domain-containing protein [Steroidobacter sp.]